jgi:hypothetical protein
VSPHFNPGSGGRKSAVSDAPLSEEQIRDTLAAYLGLLQRHVSAEEMMSKILTDDFETGFVGGHR